MRGAEGEGGGSGGLYYNSSPATFRYFAFYQLAEEGFANIKNPPQAKVKFLRREELSKEERFCLCLTG